MSETVSISYLDPVEQGTTLVEKAVDVHVIDGIEFMARWYHSPYDSDLMIWFDTDGHVARFQLNAAGQVVDWVKADGLQTGLIVEIEVAGAQAAAADVAETIRFDGVLDLKTLRTARLILGHCLSLTPDVRGFILTQLESGVNSDANSRARRAGAVQASRARFWGRFKRWTTGS